MTEMPGALVTADVGGKIVLALGGVKEELRKLRAEDNERYKQKYLASIRNYLPLSQNTILSAAGTGVIDFGTPTLGRTWTLRSLMSALAGQESILATAATEQFATTSFTAGAAANVSAPFANVTILGIDVTIGNATTAGNATVTLSNVVGGTIVWTLGEVVGAPTALYRRFGNGLAANGTPNLAISALAGGGPGDLTIDYQINVAGAQVNWYIGPGFGTGAITSLWREQQYPLPARTNYTSDIHQVRYGDHLFAVITGGTSGANVVGNVVVLDEPVKSGVPVLQG